MKIHPTALVEDGAILGSDVEIGPFCTVGAKAELRYEKATKANAARARPEYAP